MYVTRNALSSYEPLVGRLDGLLNDLFRPAAAYEAPASPLPIRIDVRETAEAYIVHAELPGVKKEAIAVEIEGSEVTLCAETRRDAAPTEGDKWLRTERFFGKSARRFALPVELDESKAVARFTDGVLELTLPKKASAVARKIEIN